MKSINHRINEAYSSPMVKEFIETTDGLKALLLKLGIDVSRLTNSNFQHLDPKSAFKLKDARYFKLWMAPDKRNPEQMIVAFATRANSCIDEQARTEKSKRSSVLIGTNPYLDGFLKRNDEINNTSYCLVIDLETAPKVKALKDLRAEQKKGAAALLKNRQIRNMNLERYAEEVKRMGFSDGSEFELGGNITKFTEALFNTYSAFDVMFSLTDGPRYFAQNAVDYVKKVDEYLTSQARESAEDKASRFSETQRSKNYLINYTNEAKKYTKAPYHPNSTSDIKMFVKFCKNGKIDNFISAIRTLQGMLTDQRDKQKYAELVAFLEELVQTTIMVERELPKAMQTALAARDLASIEMVFGLIYRKPFDDMNYLLRDTIGECINYLHKPDLFTASDEEKAKEALSRFSIRSLPTRPGSFNKKVQIVINSIKHSVA